MNFYVLKEYDSWGAKYWVPETEIKHGHRPEYLAGINYKLGQRVTVRFPNGNINTFFLHVIEEETRFADMGRPQQVTNYIPAIQVDYNGVQVKIPLTKMMVRDDCFSVGLSDAYQKHYYPPEKQRTAT